MKSLFRFTFFIPLLFLAFQVYWFSSQKEIKKQEAPIIDNSPTLYSLLKTADIKPIQTVVKSENSEMEFFIKGTQKNYIKVILSTGKNPFQQVNALQKLLKIANIKGKDIHFIDLSSTRPYATL